MSVLRLAAQIKQRIRADTAAQGGEPRVFPPSRASPAPALSCASASEASEPQLGPESEKAKKPPSSVSTAPSVTASTGSSSTSSSNSKTNNMPASGQAVPKMGPGSRINNPPSHCPAAGLRSSSHASVGCQNESSGSSSSSSNRRIANSVQVSDPSAPASQLPLLSTAPPCHPQDISERADRQNGASSGSSNGTSNLFRGDAHSDTINDTERQRLSPVSSPLPPSMRAPHHTTAATVETVESAGAALPAHRPRSLSRTESAPSVAEQGKAKGQEEHQRQRTEPSPVESFVRVAVSASGQEGTVSENPSTGPDTQPTACQTPPAHAPSASAATPAADNPWAQCYAEAGVVSRPRSAPRATDLFWSRYELNRIQAEAVAQAVEAGFTSGGQPLWNFIRINSMDMEAVINTERNRFVALRSCTSVTEAQPPTDSKRQLRDSGAPVVVVGNATTSQAQGTVSKTPVQQAVVGEIEREGKEQGAEEQGEGRQPMQKEQEEEEEEQEEKEAQEGKDENKEQGEEEEEGKTKPKEQQQQAVEKQGEAEGQKGAEGTEPGTGAADASCLSPSYGQKRGARQRRRAVSSAARHRGMLAVYQGESEPDQAHISPGLSDDIHPPWRHSTRLTRARLHRVCEEENEVCGESEGQSDEHAGMACDEGAESARIAWQLPGVCPEKNRQVDAGSKATPQRPNEALSAQDEEGRKEVGIDTDDDDSDGDSDGDGCAFAPPPPSSREQVGGDSTPTTEGTPTTEAATGECARLQRMAQCQRRPGRGRLRSARCSADAATAGDDGSDRTSTATDAACADSVDPCERARKRRVWFHPNVLNTALEKSQLCARPGRHAAAESRSLQAELLEAQRRLHERDALLTRSREKPKQPSVPLANDVQCDGIFV